MNNPKFRIYNKKTKSWLHDTDHAISLLGEMVIMGDILLQDDDTRLDIQDIRHLEVMQWTYETDVSEKDIFARDIMDFTVFDCYGHDTQYRGIVEQDGCNFWIGSKSQAFELGWVLEQDDTAKVIGNKFDNPELIKA